MKISEKSCHWWLYSITYANKWKQKPSNLCPYFWSVVLAALLLIPSFLFCLPVYLTRWAYGETQMGGAAYSPFWDTKIAISLVVNIVSILVASLVLMWWHIGDSHSGWWLCGIVILIVAGVIGIIILIAFIWSKFDKGDSNLITQYFKAKYNKYCPRLEWEEGGDDDK